ncbi:hypothetical protein CHLNCDRAFT_138831 [Chlorella variabilis]|uniref:Coenzyme Q-binding protein COQ10 START domain-containing protein n=1 Tax=Chlorella variabilis TaxID=554065 RepID=E1ZP51_CHLVA|nr:hypothetical protein CHLNCDRAFT_138831 [Chlorella variabilis]EFN52385.1 hypothetical protein CHLNCDRAFT_138831 [Chlorella variabilis]|eukprot:XP_005844487.1 hypothetical protein CHLNCDRAFT_138831 [Chlorella variabilis]
MLEAGAAPAEQQQQDSGGRLAAGGKRVAVLQAAKRAFLDVKEQGRPLAEYMVLPASQYSVLDAKRIERLDEDTFRCYVGGLKLFSLEVEPVITVSVTVQERGPTVRLLSTKLKGSKAVEAANERFDATMTNVVRWQEAPGGGKQLASDTFIQVQLQVPAWFVLPTSTIERTGGAVMARVLESAVPRFLQQLSADYAAWAAGDDTRQPVSEGGLMGEHGMDAGRGQDEEQGWA